MLNLGQTVYFVTFKGNDTLVTRSQVTEILVRRRLEHPERERRYLLKDHKQEFQECELYSDTKSLFDYLGRVWEHTEAPEPEKQEPRRDPLRNPIN